MELALFTKWMLLVHLVAAQEIEIMNLRENPGILPIYLGQATIKAKFHDFIHYYDIKPILEELNYLQNQYLAVKDVLLNQPKSIFYTELENEGNIFEYQFNVAIQKLDSLIPKGRKKRGLVNGLGTIIKSITGNLDADDAVYYENALRNLQDKQKEVITKLNSDISLSGEIIENFNKTFSIQNQKIITSQKPGRSPNNSTKSSILHPIMEVLRREELHIPHIPARGKGADQAPTEYPSMESFRYRIIIHCHYK
ncbi:uncharacterized protein LOC123307193 [Coccinella septempunctata]|uniref:uncharacterized protein LOC123307193 n=1 Tax=Coccinella septempunctata TaxID=41139 RepID=UPI001D08BE2A|nr:uncharacterized protein LOC123307193 [Coccinella septempunctata]